MKLNLPNKITVVRMFFVPVTIFLILFEGFGEVGGRLAAAAVFLLVSLTDMIDGKIARKYNLVTDLGKFLDPLADKMLVIGALLAAAARCASDKALCITLVCAIFVIVLRELAVTSLRMLAANKENIVIAANMQGKIKTVSQMVCVTVIIVEPILPAIIVGVPILSYITIAFMTFMTVLSGITYFKAYSKVFESM